MVSLRVYNGWRGAGIGLHSVLLRTGQGSITGMGVKIYPLASCVQTSSEAHPASCPVGTGGSFPGGEARPGRDADHSPHFLPRSRMTRSYTSVACSETALQWQERELAHTSCWRRRLGTGKTLFACILYAFTWNHSFQGHTNVYKKLCFLEKSLYSCFI
jgi:hypothetical protein